MEKAGFFLFGLVTGNTLIFQDCHCFFQPVIAAVRESNILFIKMIEKNTRKIILKGAYNFRDLGGYFTSEGKKTNWRKLFRSDNLAKI
ncbi:MAG: tyrosine-protein phosphatase, partial [Desulfobacteraceae bacterium]